MTFKKTNRKVHGAFTQSAQSQSSACIIFAHSA